MNKAQTPVRTAKTINKYPYPQNFLCYFWQIATIIIHQTNPTIGSLLCQTILAAKMDNNITTAAAAQKVWWWWKCLQVPKSNQNIP